MFRGSSDSQVYFYLFSKYGFVYKCQIVYLLQFYLFTTGGDGGAGCWYWRNNSSAHLLYIIQCALKFLPHSIKVIVVSFHYENPIGTLYYAHTIYGFFLDFTVLLYNENIIIGF